MIWVLLRLPALSCACRDSTVDFSVLKLGVCLEMSVNFGTQPASLSLGRSLEAGVEAIVLDCAFLGGIEYSAFKAV